MNVAEMLARQIRRVAILRSRFVEASEDAAERQLAVALIDAVLDNACSAIGSGDVVAIVTAGQQLEAIEA